MSKMKAMSKSDFLQLIDVLIKDESLEVHGVVAKGTKFVFAHLESSSELRLDYDVTILPPKKYFLPQYDSMMLFALTKGIQVEGVQESKKKVIVGIHPYDIIALRQTDTYYFDTHVDDLYLKKRKNALIIGANVTNVSKKAFFGDMNTGYADSGYDLMVTDLGDTMTIDIGSKEGERLLAQYAMTRDATHDEEERVRRIIEEASAKARRTLQVGPGIWHDLLEKNYTNDVWKNQAEKCLSCGTCTIVCPTCFCYDVNDKVSLNMEEANRVRTWDGCLLRDFTRVGSGEIFREKTEDRYRHRFMRKGRYLPDMLGFVACVGCGRCSSQCIPDIADPVGVFNMLSESQGMPLEKSTMTPLSTGGDIAVFQPREPLYIPRPATLIRVEKLTEWEILFEVAMDDAKPLGHDPGQFVELSIAGYGEAPISISSAPGGTTFELAVRRIGDVTSRLHALKPGEKVGIRGPFGKGFPVKDFEGKNILFVGGGIGLIPLRSLILYVLNNREAFGEVSILYGCKRPCEVLFSDDIAAWEKRKDIQFLRSVDRCPEGECWDGEIGVITCLLPKAQFDPENTIAVIVGPPIMYKFVIRDLKNLGMPEENIVVSLERRMKCGVGKCGHCQINGVYVCKEGPVFNYKEIKEQPEAFS